MKAPFAPLITAQFLNKQDDIITVNIFNKNITTAPIEGESYYEWTQADWRVPAEEPVVIEWDADKTEAIVGSTCTIVLVSPYDGALLPLYTTEPGLWGVEITYRRRMQEWHDVGGHMSLIDGYDTEKTIWTGWLDTEFYEEPFTDLQDYEVTLTFSDFGLLKRKIFNMPLSNNSNQFSINQYIRCALYMIDAVPVDPRAAINQHTYNKLCSTTVDGADAIDNVSIRADNFTDEDGETMTWYDVLEAVLRPLALRIEQRAGEYWVYDINAVVMTDTPHHPDIDHSVFDGKGMHDGSVYGNYWEDEEYSTWPIYYGDDEAAGTTGWGLVTLEERPAEPVAVEWSSNDQTLSVDDTFNRVKISFSPYAESTLMSPDDITISPTVENLLYNGCRYSDTEAETKRYESLLFKHSLKGVLPSGLADIGSEVRAFETESLQGGADCKGVVAYMGYVSQEQGAHLLMADDNWGSKYNDDSDMVQDTDYYGIIPTLPTSAASPTMLYKTKRVFVPNANGQTALSGKHQLLKLQIPLLFSEKYNPWEQSDDSHNTSYTTHFRAKANSVMLQLRIRIFADQTGGDALYYYQNDAWAPYDDEVVTDQTQLNQGAGWIPASTEQVLPTLIHYCKFDGDRVHSEEMSCADGMADGGAPFYNLRRTSYYFRQNFDGLYIPLPNINTSNADYHQGYWLEIEVTNGFYLYDRGTMYKGDGSGTMFQERVTAPIKNTDSQLRQYRDCRWALVGFPTLKLVELNRQIFEDIEEDDIEQSGVIDTNAADEISIDTICGCISSPLARGALRNLQTGSPITALTRAGRTATAEQLLIGTLYSQYAGRHLKLSGTARTVLPTNGFTLLTDTHYTNKQFLVTQETYNVIANESELTMIETNTDNYTSA